MRKNVWVFGSIAGVILTGFMVYSTIECYTNPEMKTNDVAGYAGMIAIFSLIFVGIKNYRDKYNGGVISFGEAFKTGMFITLIASTFYVGAWLFEYYLFMPDFMDKYIPHVLTSARESGATPAELTAKTEEMAQFKDMYKNPLFVILISYVEVVPVGLIVSIVSALILKRKSKNVPAMAN